MTSNAATLLDTAAALAAGGHALTAEEVAAYLCDHPDFLVRHPDLYRALVPPHRVHGENLADHMAAMVAAERARTRQLEPRSRSAIDDGAPARRWCCGCGWRRWR